MAPEILAEVYQAGIGAGTALVAGMAKTGRLVLPRVVRQKDPDGGIVTLIDLGFFAGIFLGALVAVALDGGPKMGLVWGGLAGYLGPPILNFVFDPILHRLGLPAVEGSKRDVPGEGTAS